ncbi:MAG: hypothetical protein ACOYJD_08605 [Christensenellales bacterium]
MGLVKCPRCELNYMQDSERYCEVCRREVRREDKESEQPETCSECNENTAIKGKDICLYCLKERKRQESLAALTEKATDSDLDMPVVSEMDEIDIDVDEGIPENELEEIDEELDGKDADDYDADNYDDDEDEDDDEFDGFTIEELDKY